MITSSGYGFRALWLPLLKLKTGEQQREAKPDRIHRGNVCVLTVGCPLARHPGIGSQAPRTSKRPKLRLIGIVVEVPWRKLTVHVESADLRYQPWPSVYEISS